MIRTLLHPRLLVATIIVLCAMCAYTSVRLYHARLAAQAALDDRRFEDALTRRVSIHRKFADLPALVAELSRQAQVPVEFRPMLMADIQSHGKWPLDMQMSDIPLSEALETCAKSLGASTPRIDFHGGIEVADLKEDANRTVWKEYDISDLIRFGLAHQASSTHPAASSRVAGDLDPIFKRPHDEVISVRDLIVASLRLRCGWELRASPMTRAYYSGGRLMVLDYPRVHNAIARALRQQDALRKDVAHVPDR